MQVVDWMVLVGMACRKEYEGLKVLAGLKSTWMGSRIEERKADKIGAVSLTCAQCGCGAMAGCVRRNWHHGIGEHLCAVPLDTRGQQQSRRVSPQVLSSCARGHNQSRTHNGPRPTHLGFTMRHAWQQRFLTLLHGNRVYSLWSLHPRLLLSLPVCLHAGVSRQRARDSQAKVTQHSSMEELSRASLHDQYSLISASHLINISSSAPLSASPYPIHNRVSSSRCNQQFLCCYEMAASS